ncbi:uncharacterized protein LOC117581643 isoform X2 [Drosophila guanche]|uniref:BED-type domain-containing protein n=1 Tax=Drosophila guanche TaxID=7266 RepID=A0A3B0JTE3_DROGU|nr:uncharacterized protein LOC117581643 isoform X2 [Drosophila guanche]SPP78740.1 Hypothetical predicted protein [Drosophila guanche]
MPRKYSNPVNKYFVYNEHTRKSTCLQCRFDMAGKHSENLMRHLKRKHQHTYATLIEMRRLRHNLMNQSLAKVESATAAVPLSSMFQFSSQAKKLKIEGDPAKAMASSKESGYEAEDQFESIFIEKSEVPDVEDEDEDEELSDDQDIDADEMRYSQALNQTTPEISAILSLRSSPSAATSASTLAIGAPTPTTLSGDDASFLQYVGKKFGNYSTRTKHTVQFQFNRILYRADMGCFEEGEAKKVKESENV